MKSRGRSNRRSSLRVLTFYLGMVSYLPAIAGNGAGFAAESISPRTTALSAQIRELSFAQAIDLATQHHLLLRLAKARTDGARGEALQAAARLLPTILGSASQTRVFRQNLAALGFNSSPLFPALIGPYNVFDGRVQLVENLLDLSAIRLYQAGQAGLEAARLEEALAGEQVAAAAGLSFVEAVRAQKAGEAAQADLDLALALKKLAENRHRSGVSTGIDVARARTRAAEARLKLLQVQVSERQALIRLKRVAGIPLRTGLALREEPESAPWARSTTSPTVPTAYSEQGVQPLSQYPADKPARYSRSAQPPVADVEDAVRMALRDRLELRLARERLQADRYALQAARFQYLPSLTVGGNVGLSGNLPDRGARLTGSAGAGIQLPLWPSGVIRGRIEAAEANELRSRALADDAELLIEEDVRLAAESLEADVQEAETADEAVGLAEQELKLARDRFSAGVGDNIELVNAQDALARSRDAQVTALSKMQAARINWALATGKMGGFHL